LAKIIKFPEHTSDKINEAISLINAEECDKAKTMLVGLINSGTSEANGYLGHIYEYGCKNIERNINSAIFYYEHSADEYGDLESVLALGRIFYSYQEVKDYEKAIFNYKIAEKFEQPIAFLNLGRMYENGDGFDKDLDMARRYYKKAIEHGYVYGYIFLAILEKNQGSWFKNILYRFKAFLRTLPISIRNPDDVRLRYQ
jgi:TPR repeat protein